ncbi:hypothetical protein GCM10010517_34400 [Streptosporangium fragile]|uniref:non-specific serine/threonine protein kinase n=1 Tax=Streptosporangium fragile TaxID=46186 RepID=A0ABP6IH82_9ACTN
MAERTVILERYELDEVPLGRGAMGEVWGGYDKRLDRRVAVKFILSPGRAPEPELERRFIHEAMVMAQLDHPGAPAVHDAGTFDDPRHGRRLFMVMQFVEGVTLDHVVNEQEPLSVGWAAAIGAQAARGARRRRRAREPGPRRGRPRGAQPAGTARQRALRGRRPPPCRPAFYRLAVDLAKRYHADDERVFQCRMQEATCHVLLGDSGLALRLMRDLLADEQRAYPVDDPRVLELRRQIGELQKSAGDVEAARDTLTGLLDDLGRLYGPDHPATARVRDSFTRLEP